MSSKDVPDLRIEAQANQLRGLLERLLEPPLESDEHSPPDIELAPREVKALIELENRGEMIMTDLASALGSPLSTATRIVDRLAKKGLIDRTRSDDDRRIVIVKGTDRAKMVHSFFRRHHLQVARRMLEALSPGEREILLELMTKLVQGLSHPKI